MVLLDNDGFLTQLTALFNKSKTQGTVYVTMKQYHGETKPKPRNLKTSDPNPHATGEPRCLFRATNGKKKLSTIVMHKDVNKFQLAYASLLKTNIDSLKKRDRKSKKNKKSKATQ
ncbi:signal recognition particle 14 kDa protein-like [Hydractinia symbiolongicarpus]|uniref:signal recognition particle 14 kDa protein-like n=1 Tax=Hydractinia symbiolongicarpus TaxID=13093 RepID=UPI0025500FB8|nr:signal recognition particle 14 kDa protein-like [Hydractinia symbiolongicarpus]